MKITPQGFAVLESNKDGLLSRWVEEHKMLCVEGAVHSHYTPQIPVGGVAVDAGAAIGDHTIAYLEKVGASGKVYAFEPNPLMVECLKHNCPSAQIIPMGLADESGSWDVVHDNENAGASFLVRKNDGGLINCAPLDYLNLDRLDFFKLDVEGMELLALKGAARTIERCRPVIVMECNPACLPRYGTSPAELREYLTRFGYSVEIFLGAESSGCHYELIGRPH